MQLGKVAMATFSKTHTLKDAGAYSGDILYVVGLLIALIMWGFGLVWLFFALASISRGNFPFNIGWWGFTFPLGVFTTSTVQLSTELPSVFFKALGTVGNFSYMVDVICANGCCLDFIGHCNVALDCGGHWHDQESYHGRDNFRAMLERCGRERRAC